MWLFTLVAAPLFFVVSSLADHLSASDAFNQTISFCCRRQNDPTLQLHSLDQSSQLCFGSNYPADLRIPIPTNCNISTSDLKMCILNQAKRNNISVESVDQNNNTTLVINYTLPCDNKLLLYYLPVFVAAILSIIALVLVLTIVCVMMQNQRKRKLHSCGVHSHDTSIRMISGMERANKRPGPVTVSPRDVEEARVPQRTLYTEAYENNGIIRSFEGPGLVISLPNHPSPQPIFHSYPSPRDSQQASPINMSTFSPPLHIPISDFSPPPSPAPVSRKSSVFTFDLPQTFEPDLPPELTSATAPPSFPTLSSPASRDPLFEYRHAGRFAHRSQSAFTSLDTNKSKQLGMRRGINLTIDLAYENQTNVITQEKRLDFCRSMSAEQLVGLLIRGEDLSTEYSEVAMNNDKVAIPGTGSKNRYADILPNRSSRVILKANPDDVASNYINANYIRGFDRSKSYIAAQGPMKNTADDFWRMVVEQNSKVIVMVTTYEEMEMSRCEKYWPQGKEPECYGGIIVSLVSQCKEIDYIKTCFRVSFAQSSDFRLITHYWYITWPDHGVPSTPEPILRLIKDVNLNFGADHSPIIIHCSAGVGRTGCYIAIDIGQQQLRTSRNVDILGTLCSMRRDRGTMIQTFDQYLFVHHALSHFSYTEEFIPPRLRNSYQMFMASMMSPITGYPPRFYDSACRHIDELVKDSNMDPPNNESVPHHEIPTTPSINMNSPPKSFAFIEPETSHSPTINPFSTASSTCQTFAFPQAAKPISLYLPSSLDNIAEISLDQIPLANSNHNPLPLPGHHPISFDFQSVPEESPKPRKKNIPQRLNLSNPLDPPSSPEPLSCPIPAYLNPAAPKPEGESCFFFSDQSEQSNSASHLTKDQQFNFPDTSKRPQRSSEAATAFPFGNLTIRTTPTQPNFQFAFSDTNLGRGCLAPPGSDSTPYASFTWPSGVKRLPVNAESPITPRTPTLVH